MSAAIFCLRDRASAAVIASGPCQEEERYAMYQQFADGDLLLHNWKRYTLHRVLWNPTTAIITCEVTYHSPDPCLADCE